MSIGQRISKLMLDMDVSNAKLARMIGVSRPTIGNWIEGKSAPTGENLTNLANALKVDPNWLMLGKESQARFDNNVDISQRIPFEGRPVPVISWVAAGAFDPIPDCFKGCRNRRIPAANQGVWKKWLWIGSDWHLNVSKV